MYAYSHASFILFSDFRLGIFNEDLEPSNWWIDLNQVYPYTKQPDMQPGAGLL